MRTSALFLLLVAAVVGGTSCLEPMDEPTTVHDLRVLGMSFTPPEVMVPQCDPSLLVGLAGAVDGGLVSVDPMLQLKLLIYLSIPLEFKALIADPAGNGRELDYRLLGCASTTDRDCNAENQFVEIRSGTTTEGELTLEKLVIGTQEIHDSITDAGRPLLFEVINNDTFKGLGGIRVPIVLDLKARDTAEHIYAQKLAVYSCQFFPQQKANELPVLPGMLWNGESWGEDEVKQAQTLAEVTIEPVDFSALQEPYVVPSIMVQPVSLVESWKLNSVATMGTFSTYELGGTGFDGVSERYKNTWKPEPSATEQDVTMYFVVRDGRGGQSWLIRHAHWKP